MFTGRPQLQLRWLRRPSLILVPNTSAGLPTPFKDSDAPDFGPPHKVDQQVQQLMEASYLKISSAVAALAARGPQLCRYLFFLPDSTRLSHYRTCLDPTSGAWLCPNTLESEQLRCATTAACLLRSQTPVELTNAMALGVASSISSNSCEAVSWLAVVQRLRPGFWRLAWGACM